MLGKFNRLVVKEARDATLIVLLDSTIDDCDQMCSIIVEAQAVIEGSRSRNVVIDMANVVMITSAALLPLLSLRGRVDKRGGRLVLCNLSIPVAQALTVSQLIVESRSHARRLLMADNSQSALAQFAKIGV